MPAQVYTQPLVANTLVNSSATAASANNVGLASAPNRLVYITGFEVTGAGATAGSNILVTVTGLATTLNYVIAVPTGATVGITPLIVNFDNAPIPASAPNTNIVVNVPSFGAGNTNAAVNVRGFIV